MEQDYEDLINDEEEDEEMDYEALYRDSQAAIHRSKSNQFDSKALQDELLSYVDSLGQKKASDGSSLIKVPSNFNSIVESMNREDIAATKNAGEKPWSQYLLLDSLNSEYDAEYNGRYTHAFDDTPDEKISRGLAQIQLLDRQLQEATRKNAKHNTNTADASNDFSLSPRPEGDGEDPTFVTAGKRRSAEPSPRMGNAGSGTVTGSEKLRFKPVNKKASGKPRETPEAAEQRRRLDLLTSDLGDDVNLEQRLGSYQDPGLEQQNRHVDQQLAQFGRLDLLLSQDQLADMDGEEAAATDSRSHVASAANTGGTSNSNSKRDYLAEQRRDREKKERVQRIDKLLDAVTSQPIRYEDLLEETTDIGDKGAFNDSPRTTRSVRSVRSRTQQACTPGTADTVDPLEVPAPGAVNPDRPITAGDIRELLHVLCAQSYTTRSSASSVAPLSPSFPGSSNESFVSEGFSAGAGNSNGQNYHSTGADLQLRPVDKEAVRALVLQYKRDVEALGRVRRCGQMRRQLNSAGAFAGAGALGGLSRPATADSRLAGVGNDDIGTRNTSAAGPAVDKRSQASTAASSSLSSKPLDLHEEAPQSVINMAHPAVSRDNPGVAAVSSQPLRTPPKKQSAAAGTGPGSGPSAYAGSLLPVPPAQATNSRSPLPLSPASLRPRASDRRGDEGNIEASLALGGWEGKGPVDDPIASGRRTHKSLRLAPHSPTPAMGASAGGSVAADLLAAARRRGGAGSNLASALPLLAPQSVFRALHGDGADADAFFVDSAQLRPSPRGTQRSSGDGAGSGGVGAVELGDQRRSLRASNVLNSMTAAAATNNVNISTSSTKPSGLTKSAGSSMRI